MKKESESKIEQLLERLVIAVEIIADATPNAHQKKFEMMSRSSFQPITIKEMAAHFGVTEKTIRNHCKKLGKDPHNLRGMSRAALAKSLERKRPDNRSRKKVS